MIRKLRVGILDLVTNTPHEAWFHGHVMNPNFASVMPQCVGVWAEELGHAVTYETFTGTEHIEDFLSAELDLVFISCFSRSSFLAYGLSGQLRQRGVITVLGGPHARSFPEHARNYFDYVCLLTDKELIKNLLADCTSNEVGLVLSAHRQPAVLPGAKARVRYIDWNIKKSTCLFRVVPMLGSLGCPYECSFCIDAPIAYQPMPLGQLVEDLRFSEQRYGRRTLVGWHDPNFGVRFKDYMGAIESSGTKLMHVAESSLSLLGRKNLDALAKSGFVAMLPGIESWYECDAKGGAGRVTGQEKVSRVAEHVRLILSRIPCVQTNFVLGLDSDHGDDPWELTKRFVDEVPGAFPGYSLISDFQNAPMSVKLSAAGRVTNVPFPLLDNNFAINIKLKNYLPDEYYTRAIDLLDHTWSKRAVWRRIAANRTVTVRALNMVRALSDEGRGRLAHFRFMRERLREDRNFYRFSIGEHRLPPQFFFDAIRQRHGRLNGLIPEELMSPEGFVRSMEPAEEAMRLAVH